MIKTILAIIPLLFLVATGLATDNHEYGSDEYDTIYHGSSPDGKYAITAHGSRNNFGYSGFHLFLTNTSNGKPLATLKEIVGTLDTGAGAFVCTWSEDSSKFQIIYRISRHEPLKIVSYEITNGLPQIMKSVMDAKTEQSNNWMKSVNSRSSPEKIYGNPLKNTEKTLGTY